MMIEMIKQFLGLELFEVIAQSFGVAGILVLLFAFTQQDDFRTKKLVVAAIFIWLGHYILLEMESAIYASLIALIRMYFSLKYTRSKIGVAIVTILTLIFGIISYDGIISILPIIASCTSILAFQVFHGFAMRVSLLIGSFLWLYYMIVQQSIPGIVNEVLAEVILIITMVKIYLDEHKEISLSQVFVQKLKYPFTLRKKRKRVDFGRFTIFRDKKKYLEDNNVEYAE